MTKHRSCTACTFMIDGVKSRRAIPHTCGRTEREIIEFVDKYKKPKATSNVVEIVGGGLKCDNPNCEWHDDSIKVEDYKDWVNVPCPSSCGSNLLTEDDYNKTLAFVYQLFIRLLMRLLAWSDTA